MAFAPMIYSYTYYRKQLKAGVLTKAQIILTSGEKKPIKISLFVGTAILVVAVLFLMTGKFEVRLEETSFTIEAAYWDNATVYYANIDNVEYREMDTTGTRIFGYESTSVRMGEFENSEFNNYSRYTYTSCDACVVLTIDDNVMVINGRDEMETTLIYNQLSKRMSE